MYVCSASLCVRMYVCICASVHAWHYERTNLRMCAYIHPLRAIHPSIHPSMYEYFSEASLESALATASASAAASVLFAASLT
jgi:hypothetical protein